MYNQITFIFRKEWHGNILSIHLTKFRKSEKWKNKKLNFVNESYIYCSQAIIFQNNWSVYCIPILWICRQLKHHQFRIRIKIIAKIFILLEIILGAFNFWHYHFPLKSLFQYPLRKKRCTLDSWGKRCTHLTAHSSWRIHSSSVIILVCLGNT